MLVAGYFLLPAPLKQQLLGLVSNASQGAEPGAQGSGSVCEASPTNGKACDFSRVVLASTEDVWTAHFQKSALPSYDRALGAYEQPTLVVFADGVSPVAAAARPPRSARSTALATRSSTSIRAFTA